MSRKNSLLHDEFVRRSLGSTVNLQNKHLAPDKQNQGNLKLDIMVLYNKIIHVYLIKNISKVF